MTASLRTTCLVAGGGPAGMMAGFLMARAGIDTVVLEKHGDFLRDFRGDTVHPSTLEIFSQLGLLETFLQRPHQRMHEVGLNVDGEFVRVADFSRLRVAARFIAFMPQWEFLDFIADEGHKLPTFHLMMNATAQRLVERDRRVVGVVARTQRGEVEIAADLTLAADGRGSVLRDQSGLKVREVGAPIDVLWFSLPRENATPGHALLNIGPRGVVITIDRGSYWQCAYVIAKGSLDELRLRGLDALRADIARIVPDLGDAIAALTSWDDVKLLSVRIDRLETWWKPGLLCIGDAAHAMSPIGGVGINLAVQDAVAAANLLAGPLAAGRLTNEDLARVEERRAFPARAIQFVQAQAQQRIIAPLIADRSADAFRAPLPIRLVGRSPFLQRLAGRMLGLGPRPETVRSPDAFARP